MLFSKKFSHSLEKLDDVLNWWYSLHILACFSCLVFCVVLKHSLNLAVKRVANWSNNFLCSASSNHVINASAVLRAASADGDGNLNHPSVRTDLIARKSTPDKTE